MTRSNQMEVASIEQTAREGVDAAKTAHDERVAVLTVETNGLKEKMDKYRADHKDAEASLRKRKGKLETDIKVMIKKYDTDMFEKKEAIELLADKFKKESEELRLLQEHFDKVDADAATSAEEEKIIMEVEAMEAAGKRILDNGAVALQKIARGMSGRAEVAKLLKKKKGKGGKGGKKKKK